MDEMTHCLIIGLVIAGVLWVIKAEMVKRWPARLKTLIRKQGLVRGYLIYVLER